MELGPLQKAWIKELRENPERQLISVLGHGDINNFRACCLGQALVCLKGEKAFFDGKIMDDDNYKVLAESYAEMGLRSDAGSFSEGIKHPVYGWSSTLASLNDAGMPWTEIADFIEANPDNVFKQSI